MHNIEKRHQQHLGSLEAPLHDSLKSPFAKIPTQTITPQNTFLAMTKQENLCLTPNLFLTHHAEVMKDLFFLFTEN